MSYEREVEGYDSKITSDCSFCTETEQIMVMENTYDDVRRTKFYYVKCWNCHASGPTANSPESAAKRFSEGLEL